MTPKHIHAGARKLTDFPAYKTVPVASLVPYARNSRTHSSAQVDKIAASIREFGFLNPIIVDGQNGIIAGHGRVMAAQKLGLEALPVIEANHLTEAQRRAYVIADNRLALDAGWDNEMLRIEIGELRDEGFDLSLTGFEVSEIDAISFDDDAETDMPELAGGDREPFQQMTFTLHDGQAEEVKAAMEKAKAMGAFVDTGNENGNGNALARICEVFNGIS
jgi:ParB family transcriptional regulator, chromosome partitioning protein